MNQRIYTVTDKETANVALVRAASQSQAIRHVASDRFAAKVASQDELVDLVSLGTVVEVAGAELPATAED